MYVTIPEERISQAVQALRERNLSLDGVSDEVLERAVEIAVNRVAEHALDDLAEGRLIYGRCLGRSLDGSIREARALGRLERRIARVS